MAVLATFSYWAFSYDHPSYFIVSCTQSKISIRKSKFPASIAGQAPANSVRIRSIEIQFALHSIRVLNRTTRTRNHSRSPLTTIIAARGCRRSCTASRLTPTGVHARQYHRELADECGAGHLRADGFANSYCRFAHHGQSRDRLFLRRAHSSDKNHLPRHHQRNLRLRWLEPKNSRDQSGQHRHTLRLRHAWPSVVRLYTYGLDLISQKDTATAFYGYDGNGNTRYLTATNATVTDTYVYDAFGIVITNTGTTTSYYRYSGEQYDPNLGFIYLRARYMNPNSGRFLSRDSYAGNVFDPASFHKYIYAGNDPANHVDPSGKDAFGVLVVISVVVVVTAYILINHTQTGARFKAAIGAGDRSPNAAEQVFIDAALADLKRSGAFNDAQFDDVQISLHAGYNHVGIGGTRSVLNNKGITIGTAYLHAGAEHELTVVIGGEIEHVPTPLGLGMDEPQAELHLHHVFLPGLQNNLGWNIGQFQNWHHGGQQ